MERLAVAQALYKYFGGIVSTKDPESLRGMASEALLEEYRENGTDRRRLRLNGVEVGKLIVSQPNPTERVIAEVHDKSALAEFGADDFREYMEARGLWVDFALWCREQGYGAKSIPGATFVTITEQRPPTTMIKGCDPEAVAKALGNELESTVMGLIGDGE